MEHIMCFIGSVAVAVAISIVITTDMCKQCIDYSTEATKNAMNFSVEMIEKYIRKE